MTIAPIAYVALLVTAVVETDSVSVASGLARLAGPDMWIGLLIGIAGWFAMGFVMLSLAARFPSKSILQYAPQIVGVRLGGPVVCLWALYWLYTAFRVLRGFSEGLRAFMLFTTPVQVTAALLLLVALYGALGGLRVLARQAQILLPVIAVATLIIALLAAGEADLGYFLPVLHHGLGPPLRASVGPLLGPEDLSLALVLYPCIEGLRARSRATYLGILTIGVLVALSAVLTVAVLGPVETARLRWPFMVLVKTLAVPGHLLERLESLLATVWVLAAYTSLVVELWLCALATRHLLPSAKRHHILVALAVCIYVVLLATMRIPYGLLSTISLYSTGTMWFLTALLLGVAVARGRGEAGNP